MSILDANYCLVGWSAVGKALGHSNFLLVGLIVSYFSRRALRVSAYLAAGYGCIRGARSTFPISYPPCIL